ncbi:hypothetical protein ACIA8E_05020 [Streptomyces sp. NPDC051664]|uniref:hypothetical protein n=1 Tax=Streptomyces sp. NPDC051664 TaxID=3365668 RepID=UPI003797F5E9
MLQTLLHHLAEGGGWETAIGGPVDEKTVATKPLNDAGWKHTVDGRWIRWIRWTNLAEDAGVQFDGFGAGAGAEADPPQAHRAAAPEPCTTSPATPSTPTSPSACGPLLASGR